MRAAATAVVCAVMTSSGCRADADTPRAGGTASGIAYEVVGRGNPQRPLAPPALGRLRAITAPTLVVVGEYDSPDSHSVADSLVLHVADVRRLVVAGAGHQVSLAAPDRFNAAVLEFLRTTSEPR